MKVYLFISDDHPEMTAIYSSMDKGLDNHPEFAWTIIGQKSAWGRPRPECGNYQITAHIIPYEVIE